MPLQFSSEQIFNFRHLPGFLAGRKSIFSCRVERNRHANAMLIAGIADKRLQTYIHASDQRLAIVLTLVNSPRIFNLQVKKFRIHTLNAFYADPPFKPVRLTLGLSRRDASKQAKLTNENPADSGRLQTLF